MKKGLLIFLHVLFCTTTYSQVNFEKGYFIDSEGNKIECLIKNIDWGYNPTEIVYKLDMDSKSKTITTVSAREFGVYNSLKYVSRTVDIDRSTEDLSKLGISPNPVFKEETLFLKVLVEGKANLYYYGHGNLKRFFYNVDENNIEQLIFKTYKDSTNLKLIENNRFRQQLWNSLSCSSMERKKFENLDYHKKVLIKIFSEYNACIGAEFLTYEDKIKRKILSISLRPRINFQSLNAHNALDKNKFDWGNKTGFGMGIEAEFFLPLNKNKWSFIIEPTFQSFNGRINSPEYYNPRSFLIADMDYQSIEIPIGIRHYFYLNQKWKLFVNATVTYEISNFSSELKISRLSGYSLNNLEAGEIGIDNFSFGAGIKAGLVGIEVRHHMNRDPLSNYVNWQAEYKTSSVILSASLPGRKTK